ncbi:electron transfer flavoprotein subunit beta/FixA family protein [Leeia sp. TBRC 13508]|uniref:Electron transfer flavoprotein subunit beta n=1 Tax=Leeia speluncae TaxID=2884804 RepID=A0ABS8D9X7_9NEIS|nr:electron transfer flavoprotein subunit beta/FixA family protein [Leeia speluncae]MCB6184962.1 electron transfer flavoprotein subunit beta/FixA family protein [Leeia speluncae]
MKVLVCVKKVVDSNVKIRVKADGSGVDVNGAKMSMNPYDEIAIEEAVRLKEKGIATEVIAITCGDQGATETLRNALAIGADSAILVDSGNDLQPLEIAKTLSKVNATLNADLIFFGKQAIDDDSNQTGQMFAALNDFPQATNVSEVSVADGFATVKREVDGGIENVKLQLPVVLTSDLRLNEPRFVTLPNIMKAKKKEIKVIAAADAAIASTPRLTVKNYFEPKGREPGIILSSVEELIEKIKKS